MCDCYLIAAIRVVESSRKPSKGKLFYCCAHQMCRFFATWSPDGFLVCYPNEGNESFGYAEFRGYSEVEKEGCYAEVSSAPASILNQDANINNSRLLWIFSAALFFIVVLLLLKM
ncbi:hypothetical protein CDL12_15620 [Handroanthus impetiginosus]|uniref:Zinc finger GRF-type domain-containing protein n=1 Tax=Handroanthus impetiginosus TaxID=429701 RepID=A0A2G9H2N7_9LAMI|nr:hypothetical protein CDL12_15620 [Handroanthus impetiginosus]